MTKIVMPVMNELQIDIWSDIACPWCYIGKRRFETALADFEHRDRVSITWHSFQLDPCLPVRFDGTETQYLSQSKGMPEDQVRQMFAHVAQQAAGEGLHYDFDSLVVANSRRAHELLHLAKNQAVADEVKEALLSAHFERGADIGDADTLAHIGTAAGLNDAAIRDALQAGTFADAVDNDIDHARRLGISGVPFFVVGGQYGVSGAQPPEVFTKALTQAWHAMPKLTPVGVDDAGENGEDPTAGREGDPRASRDAYPDGAACGPDGCAL